MDIEQETPDMTNKERAWQIVQDWTEATLQGSDEVGTVIDEELLGAITAALDEAEKRGHSRALREDMTKQAEKLGWGY